MTRTAFLTTLAAFCLLAGGARAAPVGERHLLAHTATAAVRDADHRSELRITVWYPAAASAQERPLEIGPPGRPLFIAGAVAPDAPFVDARPRPVILLSHGFGGTARIMAWFGAALARSGYVVVAVDHPGNNGVDRMTPAGAVMFWERAEDLKAALAQVEDDPVVAPHLDRRRVGVAGFSAGGFTSLVAAGARVDLDHFLAFCTAHPSDGVCGPQQEMALSRAEGLATLHSPEVALRAAHAADDHSVPGVRAAFVMAPALIQALDPTSLRRLKMPVTILYGQADTVAPPATNSKVAAAAIPRSAVRELPAVGHYDFLSDCTPAGDAAVPICPTKTPRGATHAAAIAMATDLFGRTLGRP